MQGVSTEGFFFYLQYWKELKKEKIVKCCVSVFQQFYLNRLEGLAFTHTSSKIIILDLSICMPKETQADLIVLIVIAETYTR